MYCDLYYEKNMGTFEDEHLECSLTIHISKGSYLKVTRKEHFQYYIVQVKDILDTQDNQKIGKYN